MIRPDHKMSTHQIVMKVFNKMFVLVDGTCPEHSRFVKGIKEQHPHIIIQYHGHSTPGFSVASALEALDIPGDQSSMQLVFLISDGRIERDSRAELKRLVREMMERNILLAMIIVEEVSISGIKCIYNRGITV